MKKVHTDSAPAAIGPYSQAVIHGDILFTSGQIPINPASGNVDAEGIVAQTEQVMRNLGEVLAAAGSSFEKAVKTTCFLADMGDFASFNEIYAKYFMHQLWCSIGADNEASLALFKRAGYAECGRRKEWLLTQTGTIDEVLMQKIL